MNKYIKFILLMIGCCAMSVPADRIYGLERMERLDLLPYILEGTQVQQVSSYDRSGANDDGFSDLDEYIAGTHPTNAASYFTINADYSLQSEIGRLYHLQECTNLMSNEWQTIRSAIPGIGGIMELSVDTLKPAAFHRLQVEKQ